MIYSFCKACKAKEGACLLPDSHRAQNRVVWCCDFLVGGKQGTRIRKMFKPGITKRDVEKFEHLTIADYERGLFTPKDKSKTLCEEVLDRYLNEHILPNTHSPVGIYYIRALKEMFGKMPIGTLTFDQIAEKRIEFREETENENSSVNRYFGVFKTVLNRAVEWSYIRTSPAQFLRALPTKDTIPRFLSVEEIARLRAQIKDWRLDDYVTTLLHTGIRPINIEALTWERVDRGNRIIHITTYKGRKPHNYSIPVDSEMERVLERRYNETKGQGKVFESSNLRKLAHEAIEASGINAGRSQEERFTIYGLKHCYASHLLMNGASIFDVAKLLGHTDTKMVMKHYGFLTSEHLRGVQNRINLTPQIKLEVI